MAKSTSTGLNRKQLDFVASRLEEEVSLDEKFCYLLDNDIEKLIRPSIEEKWVKSKGDKEARKKLNGLFQNIAITTLANPKFRDDILKLAEKAWLTTTRYEVRKEDFYVGVQSSAIRAWHCRLQDLSSEFFERKRRFAASETNVIDLFVKTYLPPKIDVEIYRLMSKHHLEFYWYESIVHLLLNGVWWLPRHSSVICINLIDWERTKSRPGEVTMDLKLSSLTGREEIYSRWNEIKSLKSEIFPKTKLRKRARKVDDVYSTKLDGPKSQTIEVLAEKKSSGNKEAFVLKANSLKKRLARAERERIDELNAITKHIPKRIWNQMKELEDWSLESIYFY